MKWLKIQNQKLFAECAKAKLKFKMFLNTQKFVNLKLKKEKK